MYDTICKCCGEPWFFDEEDNSTFFDYFSDEDWLFLTPRTTFTKNYWLTFPDECRAMVSFMIKSGQGCFSCGFDPIYQKTFAGDLCIGDILINVGEITDLEVDRPDPSVGIFDGSVVVNNIFDLNFNREIIIKRRSNGKVS